MAEDQMELQLLPVLHTAASSSAAVAKPSVSSFDLRPADSFDKQSVDLQLSISVLRPVRQASEGVLFRRPNDYADMKSDSGCVEAMKRQVAEQIRLAEIEKAHAERVQELSRREMELAQTEIARASSMWERAKEEIDKAERLKERAARRIDPTCMEITCHSCRKKFRP